MIFDSKGGEKKIVSFTILQRPDHLHLAVSPLELIKEGAHFELVDRASFQLTDHHPVLPGGVYLHDAPLPLRLPVISRWPVKHLVALNVRGQLLHLVQRQISQQLAKMSFFSQYCHKQPVAEWCDAELPPGTNQNLSYLNSHCKPQYSRIINSFPLSTALVKIKPISI